MRWPKDDSLHKDLRNAEYVEYRRFLMDAEGWDRQRIGEWTLDSLRDVVRRAWTTPGYRRLYQSAGLTDPTEVRSLEDFRRLPTVTKEDLQGDVAAFTLPMEGAKYTATGGSTGIPFGFYYDAKALDIGRARASVRPPGMEGRRPAVCPSRRQRWFRREKNIVS